MKRIVYIQLAVYFFILLISCKTREATFAGESSQTGLTEINDKSSEFTGKKVKLKGTFMGWSGIGCNYISLHAHQLMRSDWTFRDSDGYCIFVTGGKPDFLNPAEDKDTGRKILLDAMVKSTEAGKLYLEYISCEKID
jgi:hypothetical protein